MARALAYRTLERVWEEGAYSHIALAAEFDRQDLDARDRGLATELVYGTLTWTSALDAILEQEVKGRVRSLDVEVKYILRLGVYQLVFLDRIPSHAVLHESVEMAKRSSVTRRASGLINAVLRKVASKVAAKKSYTWWRPADRQKKPVRYLAQRWALPSWLANRMVQQLGLEEAERAAESFCARAPLWLRLLGPSVVEGLEHSMLLPQAAIAPGWSQPLRQELEQGKVVVQDIGSQLIGWMTGSTKGLDVLDMCAGLGGKSLHLAAMGGRVTSVEPLAQKLEMLSQAATSQGLEVEGVEGTAQTFSQSHSERQFDVVLVDAPCSGLGVIRRHPETRWTKTEADISSLVPVQREILAAAKTHVKPGGVLVYSVCTFMVEEGPKQVARFLEENPEFTREAPSTPQTLDWSSLLDENHAMSLWPHVHQSDAFYACRLRKASV